MKVIYYFIVAWFCAIRNTVVNTIDYNRMVRLVEREYKKPWNRVERKIDEFLWRITE